MSFLICQKHNKVEKIGSKVPANSYICMNRYCPNSFKIICGACKNDHRDHSIKVLTIQDVIFLTQRLIKTPFLQVAKYVGEAVDVMKKLKLIKQFRKKIDLLQKETQKQALRLIESTQSLIHQYAICKANVSDLSEILSAIDEPKSFQNFALNSQELLSNLDYSFQKDRVQYFNSTIKQKQEKRRKSFESSKRKIEEVKDYSMKIIEVILHNNDSEDQQEDIAYRKKHYEYLKKQVCSEKNQLQIESQISDLKNSKSTANRSRIKKVLQNIQCQTQNEVISREQAAQELDLRLNEMRSSHIRIQNDLRLKISIIAKQKENSNRELVKIRQKYQEKKRKISTLEEHLRKNMQKRQSKETERQQLFKKVMQLTQWRGLKLQDRYD